MLLLMREGDIDKICYNYSEATALCSPHLNAFTSNKVRSLIFKLQRLSSKEGRFFMPVSSRLFRGIRKAIINRIAENIKIQALRKRTFGLRQNTMVTRASGNYSKVGNFSLSVLISNKLGNEYLYFGTA